MASAAPQVANRLFGIEVVAADGEAPIWNEDVRFFKLLRNGQPKAYFYLDPYSRPAEKRGGAWMAEVVGQSRLFAPPGSNVRLPVAHMVCNQTQPIGDKPSLMTFREVETLFHEFGHALQHMMTQVEEGMVSGIRGVEWDAVELPSQFMENWCYDRQTLYSFAKHYETGAVVDVSHGGMTVRHMLTSMCPSLIQNVVMVGLPIDELNRQFFLS